MIRPWPSPRTSSTRASRSSSTRARTPRRCCCPILALVVLLAIGAFVQTQIDQGIVPQGRLGARGGRRRSGSSSARLLIWLTATYTITTRRLITRHGVITRRGHDIPLTRISDVAYEKDLIDRHARLRHPGDQRRQHARPGRAARHPARRGRAAQAQRPAARPARRGQARAPKVSDPAARRRLLRGARAAHPRRAPGLQRRRAGRRDRRRPGAGAPAVAGARLPRARRGHGVHPVRRASRSRRWSAWSTPG